MLPEEKAKIFVAQLKTIMEERNMTQKELGDIVGIKQSNLSHLFMYKWSPRISALTKIADALGMEITLTEKK